MLPNELRGRYKTYKAKTNNLIYWLTQTAGQHIDLKNYIKSVKEKQPLKAGQYSVTTVELIQLAQAIEKIRPPVEVPRAILSTIEDIRADRNSCAQWYATQTLTSGGKLEKENQGHRFFVEALKKVLELLTTTRERAPAKPSSQSKRKGVVAEAQDNMFSKLRIDEPTLEPVGQSPKRKKSAEEDESSRNPLAQEPKPKKPASKNKETEVQYQLDHEHCDMFKVLCYLQDLSDLRSSINNLWLEHRRGNMTAVAASMSVNIGLGLLRHAGEDFAKTTHLGSGRWLDILNNLGLSMTTTDGARVLFRRQGHGVDSGLSYQDLDIGKLLCPSAVFYLQHFLKTVQQLEPEEWRERDSRPYDHSGTEPPPELATALSTFAGLAEMAKDAIFSEAPKSKVGFDSEWSQMLIELGRSRTIEMWMVVMAQSLLESRQMFNDAAGLWPVQYRQMLTPVEEAQAYLRDKRGSMREARPALEKGKWVIRTVEDISKMTVDKALLLAAQAGWRMAEVKVTMLGIGCLIANHNHCVLSVAHLYKALHAMQRLDSPPLTWPDLDKAIDMFGKANQPLLPNRGTPYDGTLACRYYKMDRGETLPGKLRGGRREKAVSKNCCTLSIRPPLMGAIDGRMWHGMKGQSQVEVVLPILLTIALPTAGQGASETCTPSQLLRLFTESIHREESSLNFDLSSFALKCDALLRKIVNRVAAIQGVPEEKLADEHYKPLVETVLCATVASREIREVTALFRDWVREHEGSFRYVEPELSLKTEAEEGEVEPESSAKPETTEGKVELKVSPNTKTEEGEVESKLSPTTETTEGVVEPQSSPKRKSEEGIVEPESSPKTKKKRAS